MAHVPGGFSAFPPAAGVFPLAGGEAEAAMEVGRRPQLWWGRDHNYGGVVTTIVVAG